MTKRRVLFVHAHPDDETITTGGTIATLASRGDEARVVTCTLGEEGEVLGRRWSALVADEADQLGGFRIGELTGALDALGTNEGDGPVYLGGAGRYRDSGMAGSESARHPRAFVSSGRDAVRLLVEEFEEFRPDLVVTYDPDGGYGHPDHIRAHEITHAAVGEARHAPSRLAWVVTSGSSLGVTHTDPPGGLRNARPGELPSRDDANASVELTDAAHAAKLRALAAHRTQLQVVDDTAAGTSFLALTNHVLQPVGHEEHYVCFDVDAQTRELRRSAPGGEP